MKKGFTLAEVLIVLTVIGVLAVMTIPSLMQNANSAQKIAQFKKAFNALSNAYDTEFAIKSKPKNGSWEHRMLLFNALTNQLNVKYYADRTNSEKLFTKPIDNDALRYWIVTEDKISYKVSCYKSETICKDKLEMNSKLFTLGEENSLNLTSCLNVLVDIDGFDNGTNKTCEDDEDLNNLKCDRITFYLSKDGFTSGNPDCTISGRIISGVNPRPDYCNQ